MQLRLFGRSLQVAGDDWLIPGIFILTFRLIWIPIVAASILQKAAGDCWHPDSSSSILTLLLISFTSLCTINEAFILFYSTRGSINNRKPRKFIFLLVPVEVVIRGVELLILIPCLINAWILLIKEEAGEKCKGDDLLAIMTTGAAVSCLLFFVGVAVLFHSSTPTTLPADQAAKQGIERWEKRIKGMLKMKSSVQKNSLTNDQQLIITEAAKLLYEKFPSKYAATDFSVGLWLLSKEQMVVRHLLELQRYPPSAFPSSSVTASFDHGFAFVHTLNMVEVSPKVAALVKEYRLQRLLFEEKASKVPLVFVEGVQEISTLQPEDEFQIQRPYLTKPISSSSSSSLNSSLFSKHSMISELIPEKANRERMKSAQTLSGPSLDSLVNHLAHHHHHQAKSKSNACTKKDIADVLHFSRYSRLAYQENLFESVGFESNRISFLYLSNANSTYEIPFIICLDHEWKAVVISCRGTRSLDDVLVDIKVSGSPLDPDNLDNDHRVRSGFLETAKNVHKLILKSGCLESVFSDPDYADYRLVTTGHSLGASCSSLLAYLFRSSSLPSITTFPQYSSCISYAYSCPAFASLKTAILFEGFTISIICGHDLVPRLSYLTWHYFIEDIERILSSCNKPKHSVLFSMILGSFKRTAAASSSSKDRSAWEVSNALTATEYLESIAKDSFSTEATTTLSAALNRPVPVELENETSYLPGKILYIEKLRDFEGRFAENAANSTDPADSHSLLERLNTTRSKYWQKLRSELKRGLFKTIKSAVYGKLSMQKIKFFYTPRWGDRNEFQEIILSRSTLQDHSNIFDILSVYEQEEDRERGLRAALLI